jgi:hypothetical protein
MFYNPSGAGTIKETDIHESFIPATSEYVAKDIIMPPIQALAFCAIFISLHNDVADQTENFHW